MKNTFKPFIFLFSILFLVSCGSSKELTKAINDDDPQEGPKHRLELANKYYDKADFYKAIKLYEIVIQERILIDDLAEVYFRYANCHFGQYDYSTASTLFNGFYLSYPNNENAETAYFYKAVCSYELAEDDFRLDPTNLVKAMAEFQDYIITYPEGEYSEEALKLIDEIKITKEKKELNNGKLYLKIGEYKAAITEFNDFIDDNPASVLVEEAYVGMLESQYLLAKNSISTKQKERYEKVFTEYGFFIEKYEGSPFINKVNTIKEEAQKEYNKIYTNEQANNQ